MGGRLLPNLILCGLVQIKKKNKCVTMFRVMGLKISGRDATHNLLNHFFLDKNIILCILKGILPFKIHLKKLPENLKKF